MKEKITTIRPDTKELESHIIWLLKLNSRQAIAVVKMLGELHTPRYWEGVNKHSVRSIIESYTEKVSIL